jgi:hypothetical protein
MFNLVDIVQFHKSIINFHIFLKFVICDFNGSFADVCYFYSSLLLVLLKGLVVRWGVHS